MAYDIADSRRRRSLVRLLDNYAYRVQYSVFEMCVGMQDLQKITQSIERIINEEEDSVLIYNLGGTCVRERIKFGKDICGEDFYNQDYLVL